MNMRQLLAGTAVATSLIAAGVLPAAANATIPLGGFTGPVQLNFANYESFITPHGAIASTPQAGDQNFGIFSVFSVTTTGFAKSPLWSTGTNGDVLVGVFNDINVTSVTGSVSNEKTFNTGGVFDLYLVPKSQYLGDLGTAGYGDAGCTIASLCYHGITDTASGQLVLTMDLVSGISAIDPSATLTASVDATNNPPTGQAAFLGNFLGDPQFGLSVSGKDSFCPNDATSGLNKCPGADGTNWALASQDPILASSVPEPTSIAALGTGLLSLGLMGFKRRRNKSSDA